MPNPFTDAQQRLGRLLSFLASDPTNATLLIDAGETALNAGDAKAAAALFARAAAQVALTPQQQNAKGNAELASGDADAAKATFQALLATSPNDPALRFNLAAAEAMTKNFDAALDLLDATTAHALPQAASLRVQSLHALARFDDAALEARAAFARFPNDGALAAAISVLALDIEDFDLAARAAAIAGDHPDALTTQATLALKHDEPKAAQQLFEAALAANPAQPRALIGLGLTQLLAGANVEAAAGIERGAELFGDHIGSWIAAGWARLFAGDLDAARRHFERALAIDRGFGETHGSLAVLALLQGDAARARQSAQTALRLDPLSFSAALAMAMLAAGGGDSVRSRAILDRALNTPIDASGRTLAQTLAAYGLHM